MLKSVNKKIKIKEIKDILEDCKQTWLTLWKNWVFMKKLNFNEKVKNLWKKIKVNEIK